MDHISSRSVQQFRNSVGIKFQLYNSLFTALPFYRIEKTGILLSLLLNHCEESYKKKRSPGAIIEEFFSRYTDTTNEQEQIDLLFRFVRYVERQVVLFDALEDAAFKDINDMNGAGSLRHLVSEVQQSGSDAALTEKLKAFAIRLVLTAHPTQFYPGSVLGIINDLSKALSENSATQINQYLQQLGKTPFFKKQKPTPYDEAVSLIWYLENVFYNAAGRIVSYLKEQFPDAVSAENPVIHMGFWPGGDRDGNPNVTTETTLKVAEGLRTSIIKCYYLDIRRLKRRLTFRDVDVIIAWLEEKLYNNLFVPGHKADISKEEILEKLQTVRGILVHQHNSLFLSQLDALINKVHVFGMHFASLDVRQESSVHGRVLEAIAAKGSLLPADYASLNAAQKMDILTSIEGQADADDYEDELVQDTLRSAAAIKTIQELNGEAGCHRYIISQCNSALNVLEVYGLLLAGGWHKESLTVDIVPLFETIDDLRGASQIMQTLYKHPAYRQHLQRRNNTQSIMVGFSDGTKDGGYLMANWSIYRAKEELTKISKEWGIEVIFFDGRGGPPARGGGKTHKFYASMGKNISNREIQLTIQGQTVSSNFGTVDSAQYNIEQLLSAGITNDLFPRKERVLDEAEVALLQELAEEGLKSYQALKEHHLFLPYLSHVSPLKFYAQTNIGSRPAKRSASAKLSLKDLRAIPFVGSWSQLKQNVPGYYGVGTALQALEGRGKMPQLKALYQSSLFFRTLIDNCEMAMKKCFFPLTEFLAKDPQYGEMWHMIHDEYKLTERYILQLTDKTELMADYPVDQMSIQVRERIVLPLTTIQQYAIATIRKMEEGAQDGANRAALEKLVVRCSFGIINAGRNSA